MTYKIKKIELLWTVEVPWSQFGVEFVYATSYNEACDKLGITPVSVDDLPIIFGLDDGVPF